MRLRHVVCTSLIIVPVATARAQSAAPSSANRFGVIAGFNSATIGGKDAVDPTPTRLTGFMVGGLLVFPLGSSVAFQPELLYTIKGAKFSDTFGSGSIKMGYLEVPLLLRYDVVTSGGARPFLYAGPAFSFKMGCDLEFGTTTNACTSSDVDPKSSDYGAIIGGGIAFDMSGKTFTLGARYDHSFGKFENGNDVKHRVISVLGTLEFPMGK